VTDDVSAALVCPQCRGPLALRDGQLGCAACAQNWPVIDGIPRFVASQHLESFGRQWTKFDVAHDDEDRATFQAKTGLRFGDLDGLRVLDAGCGGGRYSKVCGEAGATVFGADHTQSVDKAAELCRHLPQVRFVQADLKHLPFAPASFDFVFSIGVMHHDVDTRAVFEAVAPMVKPGGRFAVWLYRRNRPWQEAINDWLRRRTTKMNPDQLERWCVWGARLGGIPVIKQTANKLANFSAHPNFENRVCDTFDWYAPEYQHHHTVAELLDWFERAGFADLKVLPPEKTGWLYRWAYEHDFLIGSGVNVLGTRR
jgi:SAM-dependent methyltransferase